MRSIGRSTTSYPERSRSESSSHTVPRHAPAFFATPSILYNLRVPSSKTIIPDIDQQFERLAADARRRCLRKVAKLEKLLTNVRGDLERHGDPAIWKRYGDLLLANAGSAVRQGGKIIVTDYFEDAAPEIEIEGDATKTIAEIAEGYFRRYVKARNAINSASTRLKSINEKLDQARADLATVEAAIDACDTDYLLAAVEHAPKPRDVRPKKRIEVDFKGARRFVSSDGYEILVGKKAADNDFLTFRIARSQDLWLHAADYPGSHVVVRNKYRKEIPHRTLTEAAQVAAFYSDARGLGKAAVLFTQKKFVNKPKRAAPGMVGLSSFKTIMVEPKVPFERE